ncbi:GlxA family transcriptional regulator [Martelella endophytica]|uniref:Transcriptional regulator n=1 Tax=Martelella endophytica TaxID=1486262 RepID=A0A0D5LR82_MAREN|nr:GlxA family transcriptional regulator [Martelella endophytica]AJY46277.1 transcriptional regulator [Martelella endophytica]
MTSSAIRPGHTFGFILVPGFALMSYASATEPLRAANLLAGQELFRWQTFSIDGGPVASSSGASVPCAKLTAEGALPHFMFVCAGGTPDAWHMPKLTAALRRLARRGDMLGGISGGPYLLAEAGLLDGRDFTIHWEHAAALIEAFPHLQPRQARFVMDGNRITCGGGVAPLDMMHAIIAERMGEAFARRVSDWYLHTAVAPSAAPQRAVIAERYNVNHPVLLNVLEKMEATIESPLTRRAMAAFAGISDRHLDRLFNAHMNTHYRDIYRAIRLAHARRLMQQSPLSLAEIAYATGFSSAAHFSRAFSEHYGHPPSKERRRPGL